MRHTQGGTGGIALLTPAAGATAGRSDDSRRGVALVEGQQQTVQERFRQHESVRFRDSEFEVEAEASLTCDNVPMAAARATR